MIGPARLVGSWFSGWSAPQKRQTTASRWIFSAHFGHFFSAMPEAPVITLRLSSPEHRRNENAGSAPSIM
jgi:hypothetical protein